jgi:two-component system, NarL family, invasion response regulator UvrY
MVGVLVADDRPPFRRAVRTILSAAPGFELVGEAVSGEDAVALTRALCPDVVLMDVKMPGIGGIEATRRIGAVAGETVVVLVSSYPEQDLPGVARDCGAVAFVPKEAFGKQVLEELWSKYRATSSPPRGTATRP